MLVFCFYKWFNTNVVTINIKNNTMTINILEKLRFPINNSEKVRAKSAAIALREAQQLPPEVKDRIELAKNLPVEEVDRRLALLVDATAEREVDGELPRPLVEEIARTAHTLLEIIPPDAQTDQSLYALARAADDTGEHEFLEIALRIAKERGISEVSHPNLTQALENASTSDLSFREAYDAVQQSQQGVPMRLRPSSGMGGGFDVPTIAIEEYEWLFHPSIRRPRTPEYTSGGIHPSLKR